MAEPPSDDLAQYGPSSQRRVHFPDLPVSAFHESQPSDGLDPWEPLHVPAHAQKPLCCKYIQRDMDTCSEHPGYSCICNARCRPSSDRLLAAAALNSYIVDAVPRGNGWWPAYHPLEIPGSSSDGAVDSSSSSSSSSSNDTTSINSSNDTSGECMQAQTNRHELVPSLLGHLSSPAAIIVDMKLPS